MKRGEIWWADLPEPCGRRPVVLLSRDDAYAVRDLVTVAPITTRIRDIPVEVPLGIAQGLSKKSVANLDSMTTVPKECLSVMVTCLNADKIAEIDEAIRFALGLK